MARRHTFPGSRLTRLEYTWVNTNASPSVVVGSIAYRRPVQDARGATLFGPDGRKHESDLARPVWLLQCNEKGKYHYLVGSGEGAPQRFEGKAEGRVRVDLGADVLELLVEDWWQNHPMEIAVARDALTVYFWSPRVKAVELTQGMAKKNFVNVWSGPKAEAPTRMNGPTVLVGPPRLHCRSGVFGGVILPSAESPFPIYEKFVNSPACLARMHPDAMLATDSFGQFNFGDCMGDGGWANLETQRGHSEWLHYFRTADPRLFAVAQAAARHYRDIDIDQLCGATYVHNPRHTLGSRDTSHAWIQCSWPEYFQDNDLRDDQRIVRCMAEGAIGDRGCMIFPPLGYAYRWTGDRRYLELGMATTYMAIISREFRDPLYVLAAVFLEQARAAGMGTEDEKRYYQQAVDIMKRAARPSLSNPGFEDGRKDWKGWSYKATTSSAWVPVREKCIQPDATVKKEGKQSLHVLMRRNMPPQGFGVPMDSEGFVLHKGRYVIEGWVRLQGQARASVSLQLRPLSPEVEPSCVPGALAESATADWRRWKLEATVEADSLATLALNTSRPSAKA